MSEWIDIKLKDSLKVSSGEGLPEYKIKYGQYPVYGGNGIIGFHNQFLFEENRLIIGRVGAQCGNVHITQYKSWVTDNALVVTFIEKNNDINFWYYLLKELNLRNLAFQNAQPVITGGIVGNISIKIPKEKLIQQKIARILKTCDKIIELTQQVIAKYKAIKQGLLHDLFTRGLDAHGHLRPTFQQAPELYKDSELGMIPKKWEVKCLNKFCIINPRILSLPQGFIYIDLESVEDGKLMHRHYILRKNAPSRAQRLLIKNDVLYQMVRPYQKNNLFFNEESKSLNFVASTGYGQLRANESNIFLYYLIHTDSFVSEALKRCTGSNYPAINSTELSSILIVAPPAIEQDEIANRISSIDKTILKEEALLHKYLSIKKGLMNDLLSGKKEVLPRKIEELLLKPE